MWGAVQRRGLCRPPCPALLHGSDIPLAMAWWPRDLGGCAPCQAGGMALGGGPVGAGGRGWPPDPAQPTPASRRHAVRAPPRHGSWPSCTPCPAAGRAGGAGLGDGDLGWQALAGGRRAWWRRDGAWPRAGWRGQDGAHCRAWRLGGRSVGATSIPRPASRHQHPAPRLPNLAEDRNTSTGPHASPHRPARARGQRPVWRRRLARAVGGASSGARRGAGRGGTPAP